MPGSTERVRINWASAASRERLPEIALTRLCEAVQRTASEAQNATGVDFVGYRIARLGEREVGELVDISWPAQDCTEGQRPAGSVAWE